MTDIGRLTQYLNIYNTENAEIYQTTNGDSPAVIRIFVQAFAFRFSTIVVVDAVRLNPCITSQLGYLHSFRGLAGIWKISIVNGNADLAVRIAS